MTRFFRGMADIRSKRQGATRRLPAKPNREAIKILLDFRKFSREYGVRRPHVPCGLAAVRFSVSDGLSAAACPPASKRNPAPQRPRIQNLTHSRWRSLLHSAHFTNSSMHSELMTLPLRDHGTTCPLLIPALTRGSTERSIRENFSDRLSGIIEDSRLRHGPVG